MKILIALGLLAMSVVNTATASETLPGPEGTQSWLWCLKGNGSFCTSAELADSVRYRQVLVVPTGFQAKDESLFRAEFARAVINISGFVPNTIYSGAYASQLLYIGYWLPGGALGDNDAALGGNILPNPKRGKSLTLSHPQVYSLVDTLAAHELTALKPWSIIVVFNTEEDGITANASPPSFIRKSYGISKVSRRDLGSPYVAMHELAHSALNFVDEYIEGGLEQVNIRQLDILSAGALFDGTGRGFSSSFNVATGIYDYKLSEILGANGNDNVDVTRHPSRVQTDGYTPNEYEYEGGMFFGLGTYHDSGKNIMGGYDPPGGGAEDGFGWGHSPSQTEVVRQVFEDPSRAPRPNDRVRVAGPYVQWNSLVSSKPQLMIYDGDKNHHYHPTLRYDIQLGWNQKNWKVCWSGNNIPYPCADEVWTTVEKQSRPVLKTLNLSTSKVYGWVEGLRGLLCHLGVDEVAAFKLCELTVNQMAVSFLPSIEFSVPYQAVNVPELERGRQYWWRFRTDNGTHVSGWTGWASLPIRY